jgi:hypothetical protein
MKPNLEADFMRWHHAGAEFYNSGVRLLASLGIASARGVIRACEAVYRMHPQPKIRKAAKVRPFQLLVRPGFRRAKV